VLVALSAVGAFANASDQTAVLVTGPKDWDVSPGYLVKMGDVGWIVGPGGRSGIAAVLSSSTLSVTVQRLTDCAVIASFQAKPRSRRVIEFQADGQVNVETTSSLDLGPSLEAGRHLDCLPGTSTAPSGQPTGNPLPVPVIAIIAGLAAVAWLLRARVLQR
jgi:hypothetical protein